MLGNEEQAYKQFLDPIDRHGVAVEPIFKEGPRTAQTILDVARALPADLIVMNTRGRCRAAAVLLGSVTPKIMTETQTPILVVKHLGAKMNVLQALLDHRTWSESVPKTN